MKKLYLEELIKFYDTKVQDSLRMATAVNSVIGEDFAVALMVHYFESSGAEVETFAPCKGRTNRGVRLDRWIHVSNLPHSELLFQTEIKNWSSHSLGGVVIPHTIETEKLKVLRIRNWNTRIDNKTNIPREAQASKVLTQMVPPEEYRETEIYPLLCFWEAMHPDGETLEFFHVPVTNQTFPRLYVFSISNYVRNLRDRGVKYIDADLRNSNQVLDWLNKIYH